MRINKGKQAAEQEADKPYLDMQKIPLQEKDRVQNSGRDESSTARRVPTSKELIFRKYVDAD